MVIKRKHSPTQKLGLKGERIALNFLLERNLIFITKNYFTPFGEIDLIMQDDKTLVFIEVRYRQFMQYARSRESIDLYKQKKIIRSASFYLQKNPTWKPCRFDVVAIQTTAFYKEIDWIKDAFQVQ